MDQDKRAKDYWAWMDGKEGNDTEDITANPDKVAEHGSGILSEEDSEKIELYWKLVDKGIFNLLSSRQRRIWKLKFVSWIPEEEIAKRLGIELSTVRSHLARAAAKIRNEMIAKGDPLWAESAHLTNGFKKKLVTKGQAPTDKEFSERLENSKKEIRDFYRKHPEIEEE